ncbi:CAMK protein kinase [Capronia coronata CBS 617.96]|uniref:CAMK protein kinase n=1 Tax=Capronia coronata CBS 617.96 TaxID=1182541 RepID=W9YM86_9EURO|nr:CAMK protein kinase [Capronia coronata CBS 617.96]EXJ94027.1 CAMK protein kinase [Capronia coronata CBS 617.96]
MTDPRAAPRQPSHFGSLSSAEEEEEKHNTEAHSWTDDRFFLTPPVPTSAVNPLDQTLYQANAQAFQFNQHATSQNAQQFASSLDARLSHPDPSLLLGGLHIRTDVNTLKRSGSTHSMDYESQLRPSASVASLPRRAPSIRAHLHSSAGSVSPGAVISSPQIAAMLDITPLPSPTMGAFESWKPFSRPRSRGSSISSLKAEILTEAQPSTLSPTSPRRKGYPGLQFPSSSSRPNTGDDLPIEENHPRSVSDYVPDAPPAAKPRHVAVSVAGVPTESMQPTSAMHREEYIGPQRGLSARPPTPPPTVVEVESGLEDEPLAKKPRLEVFHARSVVTGEPRSYEAIRLLGQGTFSKVYLAVRKLNHDRKDSVDYRQDSINMAGVRARSRRLVAVKVVEHGPAGGADAERIEVGLKREVDLMKAIKHPSVVHLKAFGHDGDSRALLVMNYCPGGDLFEVASKHQEALTPPLVRRIFAELVSACRYLHQKYVVHRDIKLENVLLNIPVRVHPDVSSWQTLDRAVVTLTDLGLSRRIPEPPESPLLTTRCGSEDYAAPEIIMGQPYDGRQTDAWALGVLLYALMEGRLPFDPLPGARGDPATLRARTPHRIARCEWAWVKYGNEDGEWDLEKGREFQGAAECVDGLLKRASRRKPLSEIREMPWVRDGIQVDGGLRWVEEEIL